MLKNRNFKRKLLIFFIGTISLVLSATLPVNKLAGEEIVDSRLEDAIDIVVGEIQSVSVYAPTRISIADPRIADVAKVEGKEAVIAGKSPGSTSLSIWDNYGKRSMTVRVVAEALDSVKMRLEQLLVDIKIDNLAVKINRDEGKIVLLGDIVDTEKDKLNDLLEPFKDKIINLININEENTLVQIDLQILELSKSATDELGIAWISALQVREEPFTAVSGTGVETSKDEIASFARIWRIVNWSRDALHAKLNMLISEGKGRVLSRPKLVCMSGKEAELLVGGQVPILTTSATSSTVSTDVEFRDYGITLKVKPVVKSDNRIDTTIDTEVSSLDYGNAIKVGGTTIPAFSTRSASTQLYLMDGQTIFIAGLIKNEESNNVGRLPALSDIPILGALFKSKSFVNKETELVITLTPTLIKPAKQKSEMEKEKSLVKVVEELSGKPQVTPKELPDYLVEYSRLIQERIAESVSYPEEARKLGWEGTVRLALRIFSDGTLSEARVKQSSGYETFDSNAITAAKKQSPYPIFPVELRAREITVEVPVVYNLTASNS